MVGEDIISSEDGTHMEHTFIKQGGGYKGKVGRVIAGTEVTSNRIENTWN